MWQQPAGSVLILRLSALGDVLHTLPAVAALRRAWPTIRIGWVVERRASMLLVGNPLVDDLHVIDTRQPRRLQTILPGTLAILKLVRQLRENRYEVVLDFQGLFKSAVLAWLCGARRRIGLSPHSRREGLSALFVNEHVHPPEERKHVIDINNLLVEALGVTVSSWQFPLPDTAAQGEYVRSHLNRLGLSEFAVINPGAGWITKIWPTRNYARLSRRMMEELRLPCVFTWGPGEEPIVAEVESELGGNNFLTFPTTFLDLVPLLKRSRLFVGGDTGPLQLAAALGVPIVAIFGPTCPVRNGPFSTHDITLHRELFCSNCYLRQCPYHLECLDISVAEVFEAVKKRLSSTTETRRTRSF